jgi:predicted RNA polymerase sigma factor
LLSDRTRVDGFVEFVEANERRLRHALTAALGLEAGKDAAAEAFAYGWEHWERVGAMVNPVGYLYTVGRSSGRKLLKTRRPSSPQFQRTGHPGSNPVCP